MGGRALLTLLLRPRTFVFVTVLVLPPAGLLILMGGAPSNPRAIIGGSALVCFLMGVFMVESVVEAARCAFAWTLPGYRRALARGFALCAVAVSGLAVLIVVLAAGARVFDLATLTAVVVGFASFVMAALVVAPEWSLLHVLITLGGLAWLQYGHGGLGVILAAQGVTATTAVAVSVVVLAYAFSERSFRWATVAGPRRTFLWDEWRLIPWWPTRRMGLERADQVAARDPADAGRWTARRPTGVLPIRPAAWVYGLVVFALCVVSDRADSSGSWSLGLPLLFVLVEGAASTRRTRYRLMLPWSRRRQAWHSYTADLTGAALFALMRLGASFVASHFERPVPLSVRVTAYAIVFLPAAQWLVGPPVGAAWKGGLVVPILSPLLYILFLAAARSAESTLTTEVPSALAQASVLAAAVICTQVIHYLSLKWYCTTRDLVSGGQTVE